ncbi:MAG TPA: DUF480 domain-containing protein, partial [Solirubrobacteraceae bacterium]
TPGELKTRSDRMAHLATLADVERVLGELGDKGYAERLERRPGQKEDRFRQLLGGDGSPDPGWGSASGGPVAVGGFDEPVPVAPAAVDAGTERSYDEPAAPTPSAATASESAAAAGNGALEARVEALEAEVADLKAQLADLLE